VRLNTGGFALCSTIPLWGVRRSYTPPFQFHAISARLPLFLRKQRLSGHASARTGCDTLFIETTPVAEAAELAHGLLGEDDAKPVSETRADWIEVLADTPAPDSRHIFSPAVGNLVCERIAAGATLNQIARMARINIRYKTLSKMLPRKWGDEGHGLGPSFRATKADTPHPLARNKSSSWTRRDMMNTPANRGATPFL
jgi:hypothetical protein